MVVRFDPPSTTTNPSTGDVVLEPTTQGGTLEIKDDLGATQIEITSTGGTSIGDNTLNVDSSAININESGDIDGLVNVIVELNDNTGKIPSVDAVINYVHQEASGALAYVEKDSKLDFDTLLSSNEIEPSIVLVTDSSAFDYTDTKGNVETGLVWWLGIVQKELAGTLNTSTLFTSNSQNALTGPEISSALFAETDTNNFTDSYKNSLDDIDEKLDVVSTGKNVIVENPGNGNGKVVFRNSQAAVNNRDFSLVARSDGTFDFESLADDGTPQARWTYTHAGESNFPAQITQSGNNVLDVSDTKYSNLPDDTSSALGGKANVSGQVFSGAVQSTVIGTTASGAQQAISIGNGGIGDSGNSMVAWRVGGASNARTGNYRAQVGFNYDNDRFEIKTGNNSNPASLQASISIDSGANVSIKGSPALTETNISTDINDSSDSSIPSVSTVKSYVDNSSIQFNGIRLLGDGITPALTAKRSSNSNDLTVFASQNSGSYYINRLYVDDSDGEKIKLSMGSDASINNLTDVISISNSLFESSVNMEINGHPVLTANNIGDLVSSRTYSGTFPVLSESDIALWFQQKSDVQFVGVGAGTINLPNIVDSNPTSSQVLAGSTIILTNYNNGSGITLSRFNTDQKWMIDNVGDVRTSNSVLFFDSSKIALQALDLRSYPTIGTFCWALRGI